MQLKVSHRKYKEFEEDYKNDPWWIEMKDRLVRKNQKQIELDRRLLEEVLYISISNLDGKSTKPKLDEIKKLISLGAQPDYWVEQDGYFGLFNAIICAVKKESDLFIQIAKILIGR